MDFECFSLNHIEKDKAVNTIHFKVLLKKLQIFI
jgi:hypothetical protein